MAVTRTNLVAGGSATALTTVSFSAQPAGYLLVLSYAGDDYHTTSGSGRPESTGWTLVTGQRGSGQYHGSAVWYKFSTGSETSVQYTIGSASKSGYKVISLTNINATTPVDVSNSQNVNAPASSVYTTPSVTSSAGSKFALAVMGATRPSIAFTGAGTWLNGFTDTGTYGISATTPSLFTSMAHLAFTGGGGISSGCTFAPTSPGNPDGMSGHIIVFNEATGGGSNTGTLTASLPDVTAVLTGESVNAAALAATTPKVTGALTGQSVNAGSLAASTPKASAAVAGASVNAGSLAAVAPKVGASVAGQSVNAGSAVASTPKLTASVAGASVNAGALAGVVPRVVASIADQATVTGTLAGATPKLTAALTGTAKNTGTLAAVAPKVTAAIADTTSNPGTLTVAAPRLTAQISGVSVNVGTLAGSVPRVSAGIAGQLVNVGVLEAVAPGVLSALAAAQFIPGVLAGVLPLLRFENAPSGGATDYSLEVGVVDRSGFAVISSAWQTFTPGPVSRSSFKVERVSL